MDIVILLYMDIVILLYMDIVITAYLFCSHTCPDSVEYKSLMLSGSTLHQAGDVSKYVQINMSKYDHTHLLSRRYNL